MSSEKHKYGNPSPPPGYDMKTKPVVKYKEPFKMIDGVCCQFLGLIIESGALEPTALTEFIIQSSDDDEEIIELPAVAKEPPVVIDLEEAPPVIKTEPPDTAPAKSPSPEDISVEKVPRKKTLNKNDVSPKKKTQSTKVKKEKAEDSIASDSDTRSIHSRKKKEKDTSPVSKSLKDQKDRSESDDSSYSRKKKSKVIKKRRHSRSSHSSDSSDYEKKHIKSEYSVKNEYSRNLYGSYYCEACKVSMNSQGTFESHLSGKRHQKALKARNTAETVSKSIAPTKAESRYPLPPPGVFRMKTRDVSLIQTVVEENIKLPCPGLEKVIEIQGIEETFYYCELCDAPCSTNTILPHLKGHKHQLRCLKLFKPEIYESYRYKKKHEIESKVIRWLKEVQAKVGMGRITVEKDFYGKPEPGTFGVPMLEGPWRRLEDMPGPSHLDPEDAFPDFYPTTTIPDTSKSDFYCKICDSHMNSLNMWESHIRGKRHITNTKKAPGEAPSKTKSIKVPNARAELMDMLDEVEEPVVGLTEMRETQNPEIGATQYNCFLCGACVTSLDVIEHILSQKHRTKYLEKIKHPDMETLQSLNIQESRLYSIIEETCAQVEADHGRGYIEVHVMRNAVSRR